VGRITDAEEEEKKPQQPHSRNDISRIVLVCIEYRAVPSDSFMCIKVPKVSYTWMYLVDIRIVWEKRISRK
jgi:hypothetical protein